MTSIAARFREVAAAAPDAVALIAPRARYTYADLDRWSDAIAADIVERDASGSQPMAIITRDPIALIPAALGAVKAGHFFVVLDANDPAERIAMILDASGAALTLVDVDRGASSLVIRALPDHAPVAPQRAPNELVQLVFTSGTTGKPKAIANRQHGFVERLIQQSKLTGRGVGERVSYTALPGFARATYEIFGSLLNGATLCAFDARSESLDALAELIRRERISTLTLTPALFRRFMKSAPADLDLSSVGKLRLGADVVTVPDIEAYKARFPRGCTLERAFNASETGLVLHMTIDHDTPIPGPLAPIGRPPSAVTVRVIDDEGNDVGLDEVGELVVRSPYIANGYWNAPELTAEKFRFDENGATFFTGDLVKFDANGLFYFIGRKDARLKIHGRRIDPLEIESALLASPGTREAAVVGKPDAHGELRLVAYVAMKEGAPCIPRELRVAVRQALPSFMVPSRIHEVDALPISPAGKIDRQALVQRIDPVVARDVVAADDLERSLLDIWSRVSGTAVAPHDDFFDDLGGESIVAAQLVSEVHRLLGRSMPLSLLLELNTVAKMADYLRTRAETDIERTAIALQPNGTRPPLFCVSGKGGSVMIFRELAALLGPDQPFYGLTHHGFANDAFPKTFAALAACYADAIRAIQPEGPYSLAGYSAGGLIAFDVARQMSRAGDEIAFVGLIDSAAKSSRVASWKRPFKHVSLLWRKPSQYAPRYARAIARRMGLLRKHAPSDLQKMNRIFDSIHPRDSLQPYAGRVTLFLASHGWGFDGTTPDLGWNQFCGELDIVSIAGEHHTVIREDVESLASALGDALRNTGQRRAINAISP
jgi:acyl-coenzyme A synthetase/AMP-(fatty) acid ligase/thioesterase domain-containing protein/acyl carrier protein